MDKINAVITGVGGYVPEDVLTNEDISKMVDTTDEWIMTRVGIKERRILKGEGVGLSYMGIRAVKQLLEKTNLNPEEVEVVLTARLPRIIISRQLLLSSLIIQVVRMR